MYIRIKEELLSLVPETKEGILLIKGLDNSVNSDHSYQYLCLAMDELREEYAGHNGEVIEDLEPWINTFEKVGINPSKNNPSHQALISRVLDRNDLPNINPIVNSINALQLKFFIPIGAHDLDKIEGNIEVGQNSNGLMFTTRGEDGERVVAPDEIVHADENNVLTRKWCWRQGTKDLTSTGSKNVVVFFNSVIHTEQEISEIANELLKVLNSFAKFDSASFEILSSNNTSVDTDQMKSIECKEKIVLNTKEISRDQQIIDTLLEKAVEEVLPSKDALEAMLKSGRRIKVYQGFDPTADTLHVGHTVSMRRLELFRQLGHEVIMLIGDFTARIGDPDKKEARSQLSSEEVNENLKVYSEQAKSVLDIDNKDNPVKVVFNNDWLGEMKFSEVIELASKFTVQQMLKREMFQKRIKEETPLYIHEFFYPMMQGWDSVHMKVDVEIGGNDQLFNMLAGRHLEDVVLNREKFVITGKLLETPDGAKMGKTTGNMIKLTDSANDIYGKVMSFPDQFIVPGYELLTSANMEEVRAFELKLQDESINPIDLKKGLAFRLVSELKDEKSALDAQKYFEEVFQKQSFNVEIEEIIVNVESISVINLLTEVTSIAQSNGAARRLIQQGAVNIDNQKIESWENAIKIENEILLKVGKKVFKVVKA
jgi:tyrosyl-tRNA synthetase